MVGQLLRVSKIAGVAEVSKAKGQEPIKPKELTPKEKTCNLHKIDIKCFVYKYFPDCPDTAWRVALTESGGRADAHNFNPATADDSYGIFQINRYGNLAKTRPTPDKLVNPEFNIKYARGMYEASGYTFKFHWKTTSRKLGL